MIRIDRPGRRRRSDCVSFFGKHVRLARSSSALPTAQTQGSRGGAARSRQKRILYWYDPMHPAYHSDKAGIAPDCGMALVPMYESKTPAEQASADAGLIHMPQEPAARAWRAADHGGGAEREPHAAHLGRGDRRRDAHCACTREDRGLGGRGLCKLCRAVRAQGAAAVYRLQPGPGGDAAGVPDRAPGTAATWQIAI